MIGAMSVVAAGFNKTQFCTNLANGISKIAKGSLSKVLLMYCILAMLLSQMVQSPVVVFGIVAPLCMASADSMGISKSKIALALGITSIATCCTTATSPPTMTSSRTSPARCPSLASSIL